VYGRVRLIEFAARTLRKIVMVLHLITLERGGR
jgi:hypothetical protein